jgi:hypothetical protein
MTQITPAMFEAAIEAWFRIVKGAESNFLNGTPNPPVPPENLHDAMQAAITAAIEASGLVEENARLRRFAAEVEVECNGHFNGDLTAEEALDNIRKELEALNKEPTL